MNIPPILLYLKAEWHRRNSPGFQMSVQAASSLIILIISVFLIHTYIRRRGSFLRDLQGPESSSFLLGGSL